MKIRPVGADLLHADTRTDGEREGRKDGRTGRYNEANSHISQFCEHSWKFRKDSTYEITFSLKDDVKTILKDVLQKLSQ